MQQRTDATGAVFERDCCPPDSDAETHPSPESSEEDRGPHVSAIDQRWSMFVLCKITSPRQGRDGRDPHICRSSSKTLGPQDQDTQTSDSLKSMHVCQVVPTEMVEKVEMKLVMLTAGVEKRAYVDEFVRNVDGELSDLRSEIVSDGERDRVKSYMSEACAGGALTRSQQQQCTTQLEHRE